MNLLLVAKQGDGLETAAGKLREEFPVTIHSLVVDLRDFDGPQRVWDWCSKMGYRVNILINNAGVAGTVDFATSPIEYSDERILVNVRALVLITRLFLPELKTHARAHILNIGSLSAYYPLPYKSVYAASKAFVHSFTRGLREELRGGPVQLTLVHPNGVRTNADTFERIDSHSRLSRLLFILDAEEIALIAVNNMLKGKLIVVPGFMNRLLILVSGLLPQAFKERRSGRIFGKEILED
jgi:short-subunit dehydrogenase